MDYQYWTIRYVPDVARAEFTNIGIVCGRDGGDWAAHFDTRYVKNHGALSHDLSELAPWIAEFQRSIEAHAHPPLTEGAPRVSSDWINHLRTRQANSVQFSAQVSIDVPSAINGVALLLPHLVERSTPKRRSTITRRNLRAEVRDTLVNEMDFTAGVDLFMRPLATIGKQHGSFDLARFIPSERFLTNVWAFNVTNLETLERDIQSWNFLVSLLRQDGASLRLSSGSVRSLDANTPIEVVYHARKTTTDDAWRSDIREAALEAWSRNHVNVRTLDEYRFDAQNSNLATVT